MNLQGRAAIKRRLLVPSLSQRRKTDYAEKKKKKSFFSLIVCLEKKLTVQVIPTIHPQFKAKRFFKNHIFDIQRSEEKIKEKLITTILEDYQGQSVVLQAFFSSDLPREKKI